jgi:anti-sigma-K factor RskA
MMNTNCDHVVDYLNGTLTAEEKQAFEQHLATCADCRELVDAVGELPYLAEPAEPPVGMKSRILANVFEEEPQKQAEPERQVKKEKTVPMVKPKARRSSWAPLIAAVLLLSLLGNAYAFFKLADEQQPATESAFQSIELQPREAFGGSAKAAIIQEEGSFEVVVQAEQLEQLQGDEVYQIWLLKEGQPVPAGAFTPDADQQGSAYYSMTENTEGWDTIAITREPEAGNETPEGEIVLSSEI